MWNLIIKIFEKWACKHKWKLIIQTDVEVRYDYGEKGRYTVNTYCCNECGKFRKIKTS
jgi:hypothetical protein